MIPMHSAHRPPTSSMTRNSAPLRSLVYAAGLTLVLVPTISAQSVGLPTPRLLTTVPMGGQVGTQVEVTISGEFLEEATLLTFSDPRLTAEPVRDAAGAVVPNRYLVTIAEDCPVGLHEARLMTRFGLSSCRIFSVGTLQELQQARPNTTLETAMPLAIDSICNSSMTNKAIDYYSFTGRQGQRIVVDCATRGIDSKLDATLIIADAQGRDLLVERRGGALDFTVPEDGTYIIKVHELTYQGGNERFYRLAVQELPAAVPIVRLPSTRPVNGFSWPPVGLPEQALLQEQEPNDPAQPQQITLPCDIAGSFYPAADVDTFEFEAKAGQVWWVEVASERFGRPTDPAVVVQLVKTNGEEVELVDIAEFGEIPSPVKVSTNHYAYDGPPYNAGTADVLGKLEIKEDGRYRLQISDRFGGTRDDPQNIYRLVVREATPDFALVAWALHMELRNGDRNALSKPVSLRGGATMALEVVVLRRDGFNGEIELFMENLPEGMHAQGIKIPAGQGRGIMLITADQEAPNGFSSARFFGRATIDGESVERPCHLASMAWPIPDHWQQIPKPRLLEDVPVSISGHEFAPISISGPQGVVLEATEGTKLTVPLSLVRRSEFSGGKMKLRAFGAPFDRMPQVDLDLTQEEATIELDLAALKPAPGEYVIAFYGGAVVKYQHRPDLVTAAEAAHQQAEQKLKELEAEVTRLDELAKTATEAEQANLEETRKRVAAEREAAEAALKAAADQLKKATDAARARDIAEIIVTQPIPVKILPQESK